MIEDRETAMRDKAMEKRNNEILRSESERLVEFRRTELDKSITDQSREMARVLANKKRENDEVTTRLREEVQRER